MLNFTMDPPHYVSIINVNLWPGKKISLGHNPDFIVCEPVGPFKVGNKPKKLIQDT